MTTRSTCSNPAWPGSRHTPDPAQFAQELARTHRPPRANPWKDASSNQGGQRDFAREHAVLETAPYGINNRGQIVGGYDTTGFAVHGFVLDRGRYTTIDVPGASRTIALRINARGQTIGFYLDAAGTTRVYLRAANGSLTTLAFPGAVATVPFGINNRGHVVGFYMDANQVRHGFLFEDGSLTTIDHPLAASDSQAHDLNDRGQIVGLYERVAGQAVEAREGASRNGSGPARGEDLGSAPSPLTSWWTESGAASVQ